MIKVINTTTGEILFKSNDKISVAIKVGDYDRAILTANKDNVSVYLRDLERDRADIKFSRSHFGFWARMGV